MNNSEVSVERLTFAWLYERVQAYVGATKGAGPSKVEWYAFWTAMLFAGIGLIVSGTWEHWLTRSGANWMMMMCLLIELAGGIVAVVMMLYREAPQLRRARAIHAAEMDADYEKWRELVAELRKFTLDQRQERLRFVEQLRGRMDYRMGLAFGGIQRLGIFPILIAVYFQLRNWKWGDWAAAFDVNLVGGLVILAMLLMYMMGWLLVGLRVRLDTYESLLQESLETHERRRDTDIKS
jgi:hypothetical protein